MHQENPNWTVFEQDARLDVKNFFGFESAVEKLAIKAYTNNLKKVSAGVRELHYPMFRATFFSSEEALYAKAKY